MALDLISQEKRKKFETNTTDSNSKILNTLIPFLKRKLDYNSFSKMVEERHIENYAEKTYLLSKESKGKNKKTLSDESLKEFNNLKKEHANPFEVADATVGGNLLLADGGGGGGCE
ncbi:hypothetical protein ACTFIR_003965 [Dictyostelium discoideum]